MALWLCRIMSEENFGIKYLYRICPGSSIRNIFDRELHTLYLQPVPPYAHILFIEASKNPISPSDENVCWLPADKWYELPWHFRFYLIDCHVIYIPGSKCVRRVMHFPLIFPNIFVLLQLVVFTTGLIMIEFWGIYLM